MYVYSVWGRDSIYKYIVWIVREWGTDWQRENETERERERERERKNERVVEPFDNMDVNIRMEDCVIVRIIMC